ncbi:hypothetical protein DBR42_20865 [Pelomonas sp. HMWF004]|nr:hypothetical protein DBR42_20865 [Pelomonas sp. HMWF004]
MMQSVELSAGQRRAALTLHALAAPDRDWLLRQLPVADRTALQSLLNELQELGIPADAGVIRSALAEAAPGTGAALPDAAALAQVLAREAVSLRGTLLSLLPAGQRGAVLAQWPSELEALPVALAQPAWTPRLQEALLQSWQGLATEEGSRA